MSAPTKLRGGSKSELTRLKELWRDTLDESQRDYWRALFLSKKTQAQVRHELGEMLGVNLTFDKQLNQFRDWELEQRARDLESERQSEDERRAQEEHPDWTLDQIRDDVLRKSYLRARSTGDFAHGLATVQADVKVRSQKLEQSKFHRETCELFLKWSADQRANEISASTASNADKIERLGQLMFGEDWKQ